ncbi:polysaccharide export protein [Sphingobacteriales bacterium UPWRP_1]|nr:hypothetical protein BVG80_02930 [Sphingobacteriales bacterium TSM_CSM]PSJ75438.1 polysaccharide export protein [Sphingobacteriales bacterium UPWRP_1]
MKYTYLQALLLLLALALNSCATQNLFQTTNNTQSPADTLAFVNLPAYEYAIRKDDKVSISVWDHDDLSVGSVYGIYNSNEVYGKWLQVDSKGYITVPKLGEVQVENLTVVQAENTLRELYKAWIVNPVVEVKILNKEVSVIGELKSPGRFLLEKDDNSLVDLISKAGDFDFYADKRKVQIIRKINGQPKMHTVDLTKLDAAFTQNIQIQPGDIVYVPSRKGKMWDRKIGTIIPITSIISSVVLILGIL